MSDVSPAPSPSSAGPAGPSRAGFRRRRGMQASAVVGLVGVVVAVAGLVFATRPLETSTQDCGTALTFLVDGRVNEFVDPANPPARTTKAEAQANNDRPCQERAADRALPAGLAVVGGTGLSLMALIVEWMMRVRRNRAWRREWLTSSDPAAPSHLPVPPVG